MIMTKTSTNYTVLTCFFFFLNFDIDAKYGFTFSRLAFHQID